LKIKRKKVALRSTASIVQLLQHITQLKALTPRTWPTTKTQVISLRTLKGSRTKVKELHW